MVPTSPVPNPLHDYASWSYNWSLWWLEVSDYNKLMDNGTPDAAGILLGNSYVICEQGGMYTDKRLPATGGLNYNIEEVEFTTVCGLNAKSKASNIVEGKIKILEPYGISLVNTLSRAAYEPSAFNGQGGYTNYIDRPYMLQCDFVGTGKDDGTTSTDLNSLDSLNKKLTKRFPIRLLGMKMELTERGTMYQITFSASGHEAYDKHATTTPKIFTITAGTVDEFFNGPNGLAQQWMKTVCEPVSKGQRMWADSYKFEFDKDIKDSKIVNDKQTPISEANATRTTLDLSKKTFTIPQGTPIVDIVNKVMAQSKYLQDQLDTAKGDTKQLIKQVLRAFKITAKMKYAGIKSPGDTPQDNQYDYANMVRPKSFVFQISPYSSWNTLHPANPGQLADPTGFESKVYNYMYTGQNTDILELKATFDFAFFMPVLAYNNRVAGNEATASTKLNLFAEASPQYLLGQGLTYALNPVLAQTPNPTPLMQRLLINQQNISIGMGTIKDPNTLKTMDVLNSLYTKSTGDMLTPELRIVGDPTLIKQDDWLYTSIPSRDGSDTVSQFDYAQKYGHIRMDKGDVIARLIIKSPLDIDTDITNQGGVYPMPTDPSMPSTLEGYYRVVLIRNVFHNGKFEQYLKMTRYMNDPALNYLKKLDPVATNQQNSNTNGNTNANNNSNRTNTSTNTSTSFQSPRGTIYTNQATDAGGFTAQPGASQATLTALAQAAGANYTAIYNNPSATQAQIQQAYNWYAAASRAAGYGK